VVCVCVGGGGGVVRKSQGGGQVIERVVVTGTQPFRVDATHIQLLHQPSVWVTSISCCGLCTKARRDYKPAVGVSFPASGHAPASSGSSVLSTKLA
jgi:hypothetical protein